MSGLPIRARVRRRRPVRARIWKLASHPVVFLVIIAMLGIIFDELARGRDEGRS